MKIIYAIEQSEVKTCRYALGNPVDEDNMLVIGINPNRANKYEGDATMKAIEKLIKKKHEGFILINLYPLRAPQVKKLPLSDDDNLIEKNNKKIKTLNDNYRFKSVWAAWGGDISERNYFNDSLFHIFNIFNNLPWFSYGMLTKDGHPRHPSRKSYDLNFEQFPIESYVDIRKKIG